MKSYISLFFMFVALITQIKAYDFSAETEGQFPITLYYSINSDSASVTVTKGAETYVGTEVIIPDKVIYEGKTYDVTVIGYQAFENSDIVSLIMPNTITEIQGYAFNGSQVAQVTFSKGLKVIRKYAFNGSSLTSVELFDGLEAIEEYAFHNSQPYKFPLDSVILPNTLTSIGEHAFSWQRNLQYVKLPDNLKVIEASLFYGCI